MCSISLACVLVLVLSCGQAREVAQREEAELVFAEEVHIYVEQLKDENLQAKLFKESVPVWDPQKAVPQDVDPSFIPISGGRSGTCAIGTRNGDLAMDQPLLVSPTTQQIMQPSKDAFITIDSGDSIYMYCTGSFLAPLRGKKIAATCVEDNIFSIEGFDVSLPMNEIRCTAMVAHLLRKTSRTCYNGAVIIEIGFEVVDNFFPLMEICHNMDQQVTHYNHYTMGPYNAAYQRSIPRPQFMPGGFFNGDDVNARYSQAQQKRTVDSILGLDSSSYFDVPKNVYMARGHMAAKVDFVYAPAQWATFYYVNTAPQWQTFNGGNWERVEDGVRNFVGDRGLDLDVYTGTWGVMTLPDVEGVQQELYLAFDENGNGLIPVPKIYYRVIIDKASKLGLVVVGVNNIHATQEQLEEEYILCEDVSDMIQWIGWEKRNTTRGYMYACEVTEFAERMGELPPLEVSGLLY